MRNLVMMENRFHQVSKRGICSDLVAQSICSEAGLSSHLGTLEFMTAQQGLLKPDYAGPLELLLESTVSRLVSLAGGPLGLAGLL